MTEEVEVEVVMAVTAVKVVIKGVMIVEIAETVETVEVTGTTTDLATEVEIKEAAPSLAETDANDLN